MFLKDLKIRTDINLSEEELSPFNLAKEKLAKTGNFTFLYHEVELPLAVDASSFAIGAAFQQHASNEWLLMSFFSKK